jgi:hypothetical protein
VCGSGKDGQWRYETSYADESVFAESTRKTLERAGVSVTIMGRREYCKHHPDKYEGHAPC